MGGGCLIRVCLRLFISVCERVLSGDLRSKPSKQTAISVFTFLRISIRIGEFDVRRDYLDLAIIFFCVSRYE
jgi:hypothetical protein